MEELQLKEERDCLQPKENCSVNWIHQCLQNPKNKRNNVNYYMCKYNNYNSPPSDWFRKFRSCSRFLSLCNIKIPQHHTHTFGFLNQANLLVFPAFLNLHFDDPACYRASGNICFSLFHVLNQYKSVHISCTNILVPLIF